MTFALCEKNGRVDMAGLKILGDSTEGVTGLDETGVSENSTDFFLKWKGTCSGHVIFFVSSYIKMLYTII